MRASIRRRRAVLVALLAAMLVAGAFIAIAPDIATWLTGLFGVAVGVDLLFLRGIRVVEVERSMEASFRSHRQQVKPDP